MRRGDRRLAATASRSPTARRASSRSLLASAADLAAQYPQYASQITAAAKSSFLQGDQWAYTAGIVAVLAGAVLVFLAFPRRAGERQLLADYHAADTASAPIGQPGAGGEPKPA